MFLIFIKKITRFVSLSRNFLKKISSYLVLVIFIHLSASSALFLFMTSSCVIFSGSFKTYLAEKKLKSLLYEFMQSVYCKFRASFSIQAFGKLCYHRPRPLAWEMFCCPLYETSRLWLCIATNCSISKHAAPCLVTAATRMMSAWVILTILRQT